MPVIVADSSASANDLILFGTSALSTGQKRFGASSLFCVNSSTLGPGPTNFGVTRKPISLSGDFTIEGWVNPSDLSNNRVMCSLQVPGATDGYELFFRSGSSGRMSLWNGSSVSIIGSTAPSTGAFTHWAWTRSGTTMTLWLGGVSVGSVTDATAITERLLLLGAWGNYTKNSGEGLNGWLDEVRVTEGVARYTAGFTPPSAAFPTSSAGDSSWSSVIGLWSFDADAGIDVTPAKSIAGRSLARAGVTFSGVVPKRVVLATNVRDLYYGGRGQIPGTVKEKSSPVNLPLRRKVWLMRERDAVVIRETWSDATTGNYLFTGIDETQTYSVLTFDHLRNYRAVIADNLTPEVI